MRLLRSDLLAAVRTAVRAREIEVCPVPIECASVEDDAKVVHIDLAGLDDGDLIHEFCKVVVGLAFVDRLDTRRPWFLERFHRVAAERQARRDAGRARRGRPS